MTEAFGVDASFTNATLNRLLLLKGRSVDLFVQCLWTGAQQPSVRVTNLRNAISAGLPVAGYISLNAQNDGRWHMESGRAGIPDDIWDQLKFIAVDVELPGIQLQNVVSAVGWAISKNKQPIIYTSYNAWRNYVAPGNSSQLAQANIPLWNAYWDDHPDVDFPSLQYGGWRPDQVWIEQWSGGTDLEGLYVDRNTFVKEKVLPAPAPPPTTPAEAYPKAFAIVAGVFTGAASKALKGETLTENEKAQIKWLIGG